MPNKATRLENWADIDKLNPAEKLLKETEAMVSYALDSGKAIPPDSIRLLAYFNRVTMDNLEAHDLPIRQLITTHHKLAKIIEPAKPRTILLLAVEKSNNKFWGFIGNVPFIRRMILVALIFLFTFIGLCLTDAVRVENMEKDIFTLNYLELFIILNLYITAAGLGAAFAALFLANNYIVEGTFDPKYESSYWIRFVLGIMAGLILAALIPIDLKVVGATVTNDAAGKSVDEGVNAFAKPLLAMLGGFSASLLYRILSRMVEAIESLIMGSPQSRTQMVESVLKAKTEEERYYNILSLHAKLSDLQAQITNGISTDELKKKISNIAREIMPFGINEEALTGDENIVPVDDFQDWEPRSKPEANDEQRGSITAQESAPGTRLADGETAAGKEEALAAKAAERKSNPGKSP